MPRGQDRVESLIEQLNFFHDHTFNFNYNYNISRLYHRATRQTNTTTSVSEVTIKKKKPKIRIATWNVIKLYQQGRLEQSCRAMDEAKSTPAITNNFFLLRNAGGR